MRTISIRQLHEATGKLVRRARAEPFVITDRGTEVAILKGFSEADIVWKSFPKRDPRDLPRVRVDSTRGISRERDER